MTGNGIAFRATNSIWSSSELRRDAGDARAECGQLEQRSREARATARVHPRARNLGASPSRIARHGRPVSRVDGHDRRGVRADVCDVAPTPGRRGTSEGTSHAGEPPRCTVDLAHRQPSTRTRGMRRVPGHLLGIVPVIDLRSDTQTKPSPACAQAMAGAEVGDEQRREDPTVLALEQRAAAFLGQEEAVYLPTATMANQIALAILGRARDGADRRGDGAHHGRRARRRGHALGPADARAARATAACSRPSRCARAVRPPDGFHIPRASVRRAREHAQQRRAGRSGRSRSSQASSATAASSSLAVHLDGARLANAAVASACPRRRSAASSTPSRSASRRGSAARSARVIAGSRELMAQARVEKHRFGGAMRQAGIVAAAGRLRARAQRRAARRRPRARAAARRGLGRRRACRSTRSWWRRTSCRSTSARSA